MIHSFNTLEAESRPKDEFRRDELLTHEILKQIPLNAVDISTVFRRAELQFRRSATTATNSSDPWNLSCEVSVMFCVCDCP